MTSSCGTGKKLQTAEAKISEYDGKNKELTEQVKQLNAENSGLTERNKQVEADFTQYRKQCEVLHSKYQIASDILRDQEHLLQQIDEKLEAALSDMKDRGLSVHYKRGFLFVSMEDKLLYRSGSSRLDKQGIEALSKIAGVLNDYPDVKIIVVGNTDDVQVKNGSDNWTLSTERANGVVRVLRDNYKTDPVRLTSAGRGKFSPVSDNSTEEGRAKNRRTDIILNPDMDKVWDSLEL